MNKTRILLFNILQLFVRTMTYNFLHICTHAYQIWHNLQYKQQQSYRTCACEQTLSSLPHSNFVTILWFLGSTMSTSADPNWMGLKLRIFQHELPVNQKRPNQNSPIVESQKHMLSKSISVLKM